MTGSDRPGEKIISVSSMSVLALEISFERVPRGG